MNDNKWFDPSERDRYDEIERLSGKKDKRSYKCCAVTLLGVIISTTVYVTQPINMGNYHDKCFLLFSAGIIIALVGLTNAIFEKEGNLSMKYSLLGIVMGVTLVYFLNQKGQESLSLEPQLAQEETIYNGSQMAMDDANSHQTTTAIIENEQEEKVKEEKTDNNTTTNIEEKSASKSNIVAPVKNDFVEVESPPIPRKDLSSKVFDVVEEMPSFPGGNGALMSFLQSNVKYPVVAQENYVQGRVQVGFIIETDGSISGVKIVRSVDPALDQEAMRVVRSMPRWNPGKQSGQPVRVRYTVPVLFRLQ